MFRFEKYEDSLEEQWDKFITEKSINLFTEPPVLQLSSGRQI